MIHNYISIINDLLDKKKADFIVFFSFDEFFLDTPPNWRNYLYLLTDFNSSNAILLYSKEKSFYFTDGRYLFEAGNFFKKNTNIEVLDISSNNFVEKIVDKKVIFFEESLKLDFYLKNKEKFKFIFLNKEELLNIFDKSLLKFNKNIIKQWKVKYPQNLLKERTEQLLIIIKNILLTDNLADKNCIFFHNVEFASWFTGIRTNISQNCAKENILFIFFDKEFSIIEQITIEGNNSHELIKLSNKLMNCNIFSDRKISYFYNDILVKLCNNLFFYDFNFAEFQSIKNNFEIKKIKKAHLDNAKSFNFFTKWIKKINFTKNKLSEYDIAVKLEEFLSKDRNFVSLSFNSIVGADSNSAIIHYKPTKEKAKIIQDNSIILIDCGGQYKFGTTDMTRMIILCKKKDLSKEFRICYTFVLKAHIQLAKTIFIEGTTGKSLDFVARKEIFKIYKNYNHGTGHGVGFNLNVHEYPGISYLSENEIKENHIVSIEPGIYIENNFGIRIENLYVIKKVKNHQINNKNFLFFEPLTFINIDIKPIIFNLLNKEELNWLERYNAKCSAVLNPLRNKKLVF